MSHWNSVFLCLLLWPCFLPAAFYQSPHKTEQEPWALAATKQGSCNTLKTSGGTESGVTCDCMCVNKCACACECAWMCVCDDFVWLAQKTLARKQKLHLEDMAIQRSTIHFCIYKILFISIFLVLCNLAMRILMLPFSPCAFSRCHSHNAHFYAAILTMHILTIEITV